jgi:hypothetical protein
MWQSWVSQAGFSSDFWTWRNFGTKMPEVTKLGALNYQRKKMPQITKNLN